MLFNDELRLAALIALNSLVLCSAWRATRRWSSDLIQRALDTSLLWLLTQYLAVCVPGILGCLSAVSMGCAAIFISAGLFVLGRKPMEGIAPQRRGTALAYDMRVYGIAFFFTLFEGLSVIWEQRLIPLIDSDAMTYHVPAAVHWLQTGRISLLPVWFFNPANTFSPLAGSTFICWLLAPLGNDSVARGVQLPAMLMLFLAVLQTGRAMRFPPIVAAVLAMAVALSRPFNSELMSARDDVFLSALLAVVVAGCGRDAITDRFAPWRIGIALGLAMATKYTFVFAAPVVLLLVDAPIKARWRPAHWIIFLSVATVLAGPWYVRNWALTGNPIYPVDVSLFGHRILTGIFEARPSDRLRSWAGISGALVNGFHAPPKLLQAALGIGWIAALVTSGRTVLREPLTRVCLLGFPCCLALFLARAPYGEVRFLFPALPLLFVACGMALNRWLEGAIVAATALFILSIGTSYNAWDLVLQITAVAVGLTALVVGWFWLDGKFAAVRRRLRLSTAAALLLGLGAMIYIFWHAYLNDCRDMAMISWEQMYATLGGNGWKFVDQNIPGNATIAYTNTYLINPLYGPEFRRRLIYVPLDGKPADFLSLPRFPAPLVGERIEATFTRMLHEHLDESAWKNAMLHSGADYLFIVPQGTDGPAPELKLARAYPETFEPLFEDQGAVIYRIHRP